MKTQIDTSFFSRKMIYFGTKNIRFSSRTHLKQPCSTMENKRTMSVISCILVYFPMI